MRTFYAATNCEKLSVSVRKVEATRGVLGQVRLLHRRIGLLGVKEDFHLLLHQDLLSAC